MNTLERLTAATDEHDALLELVRMCVADLGYDPELIQPYDGRTSGFTFISVRGLVPSPVCWRAKELVGIGDPKCFVCTMRDSRTDKIGGCDARRRFVRNCRFEV